MISRYLMRSLNANINILFGRKINIYSSVEINILRRSIVVVSTTILVHPYLYTLYILGNFIYFPSLLKVPHNGNVIEYSVVVLVFKL